MKGFGIGDFDVTEKKKARWWAAKSGVMCTKWLAKKWTSKECVEQLWEEKKKCSKDLLTQYSTWKLNVWQFYGQYHCPWIIKRGHMLDPSFIKTKYSLACKSFRGQVWGPFYLLKWWANFGARRKITTSGCNSTYLIYAPGTETDLAKS